MHRDIGGGGMGGYEMVARNGAMGWRWRDGGADWQRWNGGVGWWWWDGAGWRRRDGGRGMVVAGWQR
ncbi:hypothetical protein [Paenibacillus riograndensis]|uniref:hypothetical protein n=1 Tax=Paenibacillus riograndensis TaxID=483937 RepID=UPI0011462740|nr:hypothetical protein [Paenibacillus riograndensis]